LARRPRFISTQFTRIERGKSVAKPETLAAIREALEKDQGCGLLNRAGSSAGGVNSHAEGEAD